MNEEYYYSSLPACGLEVKLQFLVKKNFEGNSDEDIYKITQGKKQIG